MGNKLRQKQFFSGSKKTKSEEVREILQGVVLAHVPVSPHAYSSAFH